MTREITDKERAILRELIASAEVIVNNCSSEDMLNICNCGDDHEEED